MLCVAGAAAALVGPVELLIHNASTLGALPVPLLLDTTCESLEEVLRTNVVGPFRLTKAIAGHMAARGRGLVVHVTSDAATEAVSALGCVRRVEGSVRSAHARMGRRARRDGRAIHVDRSR